MKPFYQRTGFIIAMLIVLPPLGIYLVLKQSHWDNRRRTAAVILSACWFIVLLIASAIGTDDPETPEQTSPTALSSDSRSAEYGVDLPETTQPETQEEEPSAAEQPPTVEPGTEKAGAPSTTRSPSPARDTPADDPPGDDIGYTYVLNTNTKKYHRPSCRDVKRIKPENYATSSTIPPGYSPCGHCHP